MPVRRLLVAAATCLTLALAACGAGGPEAVTSSAGSGTSGSTVATGGTQTSPASPPAQSAPADQTHLHFVKDAKASKITPKSVQANGHGLLIANNMFYTHSVTLYDAKTQTEKAVVKDSINLADFGFPKHPGESKGSPVEATWTKDGRYAYITNYTMYGVGFNGRAKDYCSPASGYHSSYVYRLDTQTMKYDQAIHVGVVPKFLLMAPDQKHVLVANWCSYTVGLIDTATHQMVQEIPTGANPRGLAISADSSTAYVACEGTGDIYKLDLKAGTSKLWLSPGEGPRTLILSPDGKYMYATLANADKLVKIDVARAKVVAQTYPGLSPRSMDISSDGTALYSVQFDEATVTKVRTSDLAVIDKRRTPPYPIGLAYEPTTRSVWVALYPGQMYVYEDTSTTDFPAERVKLDPGPVVGTGSRDYGGDFGPAPVAATSTPSAKG